MEITLMSDQALINELLSPGHAEPMAADSHPYIQTALPLATQASQQQRLRRILDLSKELLMRDLRHDWILRPMVNSPAAFKEWLRLRFANLEHEIFLVVFLDAQQRIIDAEVMFRGTLTQTSVYPREVVKAAMRHNAAAIAMAHNHPSGHVEPSAADRQLTQTLRSIHVRVSQLRLFSLQDPARAEASIEELRSLVAHIRARDGAAAERESIRHVANAAATALAVMGKDDLAAKFA